MKRKTKKLLMVLLSVTLVALIGIGATLAYFTDEDEAVNVVTLGHVEIGLKEPHFPGGPDGGEITNVTPGDEYPKDPTITVDSDSQTAYVRMSMRVRIRNIHKNSNLNEKGVDEAIADLIENGINIDKKHWYLASDGYYYYNEPLDPTESATLFTKVNIPTYWDNNFQDCSVDISLRAQAIQAEGFSPRRETIGGISYITGWYYSDGKTPVTPENYRELID